MRDFLFNKIKNSIYSVTDKDIYAFGLYLEYLNDNPYEPMLIFGYNTISNMKNACKEADELEAKWNYAYWLQNELFVFGIEDTAEIVKKWFTKNKFGYKSYDEFFSSDFDDDICNKIDKAVKKELVEVVKSIQDSNVIQTKFGRPMPIIIHELEYTDDSAKINKKANPKSLVSEFADFCKGY